ncbi:hypothetical protein [Pseudoduganella violaceinigra]|uniref:hypothetical protein n=1 Tax=Pseudoduganella violaceinigra TaxID=246602 RepID=UPI0012B610A8|nr:hypothetical protein [Pseudoduganella violaceinigra]
MMLMIVGCGNESISTNKVKIMYKCDELLSLLGSSVNDHRLVEYFSPKGIDLLSALLLDEGEFTAYLQCKADGISFVFTDEAMFLQQDDQPIGLGPLYFSGFFLYSEGKEGFRRFTGQLPKALSFSDTQLNVQKKFARTADFRTLRDDGTVVRERWDEGGDSIGVSYAKGADKGVEVISVFRPRIGQILPVGTVR